MRSRAVRHRTVGSSYLLLRELVPFSPPLIHLRHPCGEEYRWDWVAEPVDPPAFASAKNSNHAHSPSPLTRRSRGDLIFPHRIFNLFLFSACKAFCVSLASVAWQPSLGFGKLRSFVDFILSSILRTLKRRFGISSHWIVKELLRGTKAASNFLPLVSSCRRHPSERHRSPLNPLHTKSALASGELPHGRAS